MKRGAIVFSKKGRDKGKPMVVLDSDGEYLILVDGKLRTLEKPKKKKQKHVQPTNFSAELQPPCGRAMQNADIRKLIENFLISEGGSERCQKTM
ncbi:MAG: KOW domain-containing RNA-binding protein [Defluviitaleaceae bacterium]|nr:KOW domain-containing RNA-binding protein [Defluviitaleaceae bacterium]